MNTKPNEPNSSETDAAGPLADSEDRREMLEKFGRFAAYAAPFTILALAKKADAATGGGPVKHQNRPR